MLSSVYCNYKKMNFSAYRRKNQHPVAFSLFRQFYYDYAKNQSKKQRNYSQQREDSLPKKNHIDKFSQFVNAITSRKPIHHSPRSICLEDNLKKTHQFSGFKEGSKNHMKDNYWRSQRFPKCHILMKKGQLSTERLEREGQTQLWKEYLKRSDSELRNGLEMRKQVRKEGIQEKEMKKKMLILNEDKNQKIKTIRRNILMEKHQPQSKACQQLFNKTTFQNTNLRKTKQNIFPPSLNL